MNTLTLIALVFVPPFVITLLILFGVEYYMEVCVCLDAR